MVPAQLHDALVHTRALFPSWPASLSWLVFGSTYLFFGLVLCIGIIAGFIAHPLLVRTTPTLVIKPWTHGYVPPQTSQRPRSSHKVSPLAQLRSRQHDVTRLQKEIHMLNADHAELERLNRQDCEAYKRDLQNCSKRNISQLVVKYEETLKLKAAEMKELKRQLGEKENEHHHKDRELAAAIAARDEAECSMRRAWKLRGEFRDRHQHDEAVPTHSSQASASDDSKAIIAAMQANLDAAADREAQLVGRVADLQDELSAQKRAAEKELAKEQRLRKTKESLVHHMQDQINAMHAEKSKIPAYHHAATSTVDLPKPIQRIAQLPAQPAARQSPPPPSFQPSPEVTPQQTLQQPFQHPPQRPSQQPLPQASPQILQHPPQQPIRQPAQEPCCVGVMPTHSIHKSLLLRNVPLRSTPRIRRAQTSVTARRREAARLRAALRRRQRVRILHKNMAWLVQLKQSQQACKLTQLANSSPMPEQPPRSPERDPGGEDDLDLGEIDQASGSEAGSVSPPLSTPWSPGSEVRAPFSPMSGSEASFRPSPPQSPLMSDDEMDDEEFEDVDLTAAPAGPSLDTPGAELHDAESIGDLNLEIRGDGTISHVKVPARPNLDDMPGPVAVADCFLCDIKKGQAHSYDCPDGVEEQQKIAQVAREQGLARQRSPQQGGHDTSQLTFTDSEDEDSEPEVKIRETPEEMRRRIARRTIAKPRRRGETGRIQNIAAQAVSMGPKTTQASGAALVEKAEKRKR